MERLQAQRILIEHRYRRELPFPISTAFTHYSHSPTKNHAVRAWRLITAAESTLRYAAIVAACDYATDPAADPGLLEWLKGEWLGHKALSFGTWSNGLMKIRKELGRTWQAPFISEFQQVDTGRLASAIEQLVSARNQMAHGERVEVLSYQQFLKHNEDNLFTILEELQFLGKYQLCFAEVDEDEAPVQGTRQTLNLCRGAARSFLQCTVTPSQPIPPGVPFVWHSDFSGILLLSPFFIYGRASTEPDAPVGKAKAKAPVRVQLQGLMVLNRVRGNGNYASLDQEARISLPAFMYPAPGDIQRLLDEALGKDAAYPRRVLTSIPPGEKDHFGRQPGDVPVGFTFKGEKDAYVVEREPVGRGGMGVVYLVRRQSDNMFCALKAMPLEMMMVGSLVKRFEREGRMLLELSKEGNQNLIRLLDVGYQDPYHFLVMEYVKGGTLADELWQRSGNKPPFRFGEALTLIEQACNGVRSIHAKGLIHRDLKPANLLLDPQLDEDGDIQSVGVKITDFGLARRLGQQSIALTMELGALGTFLYMPPEQFEDTGCPVDQRADIYSLGKILAEMLTGVVPRNAEEIEALDFTPLGEQALRDDGGPSAGSSPVPDESVPTDGIKRILTCALAKDPAERFGRVEDLMDAIRKAARIDEADQESERIGITRPDVRAAFALARIGHPQANKRLLGWCADQVDPRHEEGAVAMAALGETGLAALIQEAEQAQADSDAERSQSLAHAVSCALRWKELTEPHLMGQPWLRRVSRSLRQRVKKCYFRSRLQVGLKELSTVITHYAGMAVLGGCVTAATCCFFEASIFWRTVTEPEAAFGIKLVLTSLGWVIPPCVAVGAAAFVAWLASMFSRPTRFLVILGGGAVVSPLIGLLAWCMATAVFRANPEIIQHFDKAAVLSMFQGFWWWFAMLATFGVCAGFALKELPAIQRRGPSLLLSVVSFTGPPVLCGLPIALGLPAPFLLREALGSLASIAAAGVGAGVADWLLERKRSASRGL